MRTVTLENLSFPVGAVLTDLHGQATTPCGTVVREVFLEGGVWTSTTWISQDGDAFQRQFNLWDSSWTFSGKKNVGVSGGGGELTVCVGSGEATQSMRLVRAIATAWVALPHSDAPLVAAQLDLSAPLCANNVGWVSRSNSAALSRGGAAVTVACAEDAPVQPVWRQQWEPATVIRYWPWGDPQEFPTASEVSSSGWLRRADGDLSLGTLSYNGRLRFCFDTGAVWADELVSGVYRGPNPNPLTLAVVPVDGNYRSCSLSNLALEEKGPPRRSRALADEAFSHFCGGMTIEQVSAHTGATRSAVWKRLFDATLTRPASQVPEEFWKRALSSAPLRDAIAEMAEDADPALGGTLTGLRDAAAVRIDVESIFSDRCDDLFGMLRLAQQLEQRRRLNGLSKTH